MTVRDGEGGCVFASELVSPMNSSNLQAAMSREHHRQKEVSVLTPYRWPLKSKRYGRAHDVRAAIDSTAARPKAGDRHPPAGLGSVCHWPEDMGAQPAPHCVCLPTLAYAAQCSISSTRQATLPTTHRGAVRTSPCYPRAAASNPQPSQRGRASSTFGQRSATPTRLNSASSTSLHHVAIALL